MVVTGDITQIDLPAEQESGLVVVSEILDGVDGIEFVRFGEEDVVRHKLVRRIVAAYAEHAQRQAPELRARSRAHGRRECSRADEPTLLDIEVIGVDGLRCRRADRARGA